MIGDVILGFEGKQADIQLPMFYLCATGSRPPIGARGLQSLLIQVDVDANGMTTLLNENTVRFHILLTVHETIAFGMWYLWFLAVSRRYTA
jgi:hypothetical protein